MKHNSDTKKSDTKKSNAKTQAASGPDPVLTLGDYTRTVLDEQYHTLVKYEKKVLADEDPENLHKMRVASRKLRTALQVFDRAVELPKAGSIKQISALAKVLGRLRDLDVQIADLNQTYRPQLAAAEQALLDQAIKSLHKQRYQAYAAVEDTLRRSRRYRALKTTYETWLTEPQYTSLAQLPLIPLLPDLLSPLLAELLLHPGWLIAADHSPTEAETLHDLRKTFKHVRYQTEFFVSFYGEPFEQWIKEVKQLQEQLGKLQDSHVLEALLNKHLPKHTKIEVLQASIQQTQTEALANWDQVRQKYLDPEFRGQLRQMLLEPLPLTANENLPDSNPVPHKTPTKTAAKTAAAAKTSSKVTSKAAPKPGNTRKK